MHDAAAPLLALAASHLCKLYPNFEDSLVLQRSLAPNHLKQDLSASDDTTTAGREDAFAATVLLCLLEICQGNSYKWILHLRGAHALLSARATLPTSSRMRDGTLMTFMLDVDHSILCMARLTAANAANIPSLTNVSQAENALTSTTPVYPVSGLAEQLLFPLFMAGVCAHRKSERTA